MKWLKLSKLPKHVFGRCSVHIAGSSDDSVKIAVLGPPGSGTYDYARKIQSTFNIVQVSVPQLVSASVRKGTKMKELVETYTNNNKPIPDHKLVDFVVENVKRMGNDSWVMNGFPTSLEQAEMLWEDFELQLVLQIILPNEILVNNLLKRYGVSIGKIADQKYRNDIVTELDGYMMNAWAMFDFYGDKNVLRKVYSDSPEGAWTKVERHVKRAISSS